MNPAKENEQIFIETVQRLERQNQIYSNGNSYVGLRKSYANIGMSASQIARELDKQNIDFK